MKNTLLVLVLVLVVGFGAYSFMTKNASQTPVDTTLEAETSEPSGVMSESGAVKEFTVDASEFKFDTTTITVKKGDTVKLTLTNSGKYTHDWVIDEFNGATKQIKAGETDTITFVADKAGTFEYYCSVMEHRKQGQVGKLIVTE